ncbi:arginine-tRNA-protein transferase [Diplocarpon rosae]|nr:arginine-tRNA-protein transferase [Diplocarpon rosae]
MQVSFPAAAPAQHLHHADRLAIDPYWSPSRSGACVSRFLSRQRTLVGTAALAAATAIKNPEFYQSLLDRGWRRSGVLLYKPDQRASCCPHYTIRLNSEEFRASKDQRQVQNRFNKYLLGDFYIKEAARLYPLSREQARKRNTEFDLTQRVHECEQNQLQTPPEPAHRFVVTLEPDIFTEEKYTLFENYQRLVHNEPPHRITKSGFTNFLCSSPIPRDETAVNGQRIGSYHQCYRLDEKLVAIGVLDLLPQCVSAVYFMYDESVHQHAFGKLGALREISLAKEGNYKYWYAGFYIHSCAKMRYKGDYTPQHLLDPESYDWNILDNELRQKLDKTKYFSLSRERSSLAADSSEKLGVIDSKIPEDGVDFDFDEHHALSDSGMPLFSRSIPGILTKTQLLNEVDLDSIKISVRGIEAEAKDLVSWESSDIDSPSTTKCIISELAAAVGPVNAMEMIVKFG